jgi:hypothetical protein
LLIKCVGEAVEGLGKASAFANYMQAIFCNQLLHNMLHSVLLTALNKTMQATCRVASM